MIQLKHTDNGIYYLYDYIPTRKRYRFEDDEVKTSQDIIYFKNGQEPAHTNFSNDLMWAVTQLSRYTSSDKIGLIAVPPSKSKKYSPIRESIEAMKSWYDNGTAKNHFGFNKTLYDYQTLLTRSGDIVTSHEGRRATYEEQKNSIYCSRNRLSRYWTTFIILDDVTTTGLSLNVCRDILVEHGANERFIYRLALSHTV